MLEFTRYYYCSSDQRNQKSEGLLRKKYAPSHSCDIDTTIQAETLSLSMCLYPGPTTSRQSILYATCQSDSTFPKCMIACADVRNTKNGVCAGLRDTTCSPTTWYLKFTATLKREPQSTFLFLTLNNYFYAIPQVQIEPHFQI